MQFAWTSAVTPILSSKDSPVVITRDGIFWLEYVLFIAGIIGVPFTIYITKRFGRKKSILIAAAENLFAWILIGTTSSLTLLFIGRFISGIAAVVAFVSVPMYIGEIADKKIRGFLSSWIYMMMLTGFLVINAVGPFVSIMTSSIIAASFPTILLITFPFMPESPYYYILNGKVEDARRSLRKLRSRSDVEEELEQIAADVVRQQSEQGRPIDLFIIPSNRKAFFIMAVLNCSQHMCGFSVILMNLQQILIDGKSSFNANTIGIWFSIVMLVTAFGSTCLVDKLGRRFLLILSSLLTGIVMLCLSIYYGIPDLQKSANWIPAVFIILYAATFKLGLGIVPIVTTGELFPTSVKSTGMALSDSLYSFCSIISVLVYQVLSENFGIYSALLVFAIWAIMTAVYTYFYIPETTGKTLEEIQMMLKGKSYEPLINKRYGTTG